MDEDWNKNKFKGNIAENTIKFLIESMPNWKCNEFGVEIHIKDIKNLVRKNNTLQAIKVRKMPDFVVFNKETGRTFFLEVKYNSSQFKDGYFFTYLENYKEHWLGTILILVRSHIPYFVWIDLDKITESMKKRETIDGKNIDIWTFGELQQDIKTLFPDLKEENILEAVDTTINLYNR